MKSRTCTLENIDNEKQSMPTISVMVLLGETRDIASISALSD